MHPSHPMPHILRSFALALAVFGLSHAAPVAVVAYTYDTTQPNTAYGPWGDAGNVKLTDGVIPAPTNYSDAGHVGFYATLPNPQITLDLGASYSLATVKLSYWADASATYFGPRNDLGDRLLISVSNDNVSYSTPVEYSPFTGPPGQEVTSPVDVTGKSGRYVRLLVHCHNDPGGVQWIWLSEVSVTSTAPDTGATQTRVETAADGSGSVVGAQNITAGNSITVYAVTRNASGTFVGNPSATWSLQSTTGGVVSGDLVAAGSSAVFTGHLTGTTVIRAFASGFTGNSGTQTVTAGPANKLAFTTQPGGGQPGSAWATQPVVKVQDAGGNTVTSNTSTVTLAISNNAGPGGVLSGTKAKAAVAGVATFSGLSIDVYGTGYTLSATAGSLTSATSAPFNINSTATVALTKPITRQVVQRGSANTGTIAIQGTYAGTPTSIEARALVMAGSGNSGSDSAWITLTPSPTGGTFSGSLGPVTAGGWYQIEVRSVTAGAPGVTSSVQRVGVGDVYLTAGQSNSANWGTPAGVCADDRVSSYNYSNGSWAKAADPMPGAGGGGGSVWTRLGDLLAARDNLPVAFACMGEGSSQVADWVPVTGGYYASHITAAVQAFPVNGFRAFLWHQGESDALASSGPAVYQTRLNSVISQSRVDAGWSVPWYISEASFHPGSALSQEEPVVEGQRRVIEGDALVFPGPVTDDFHLNGGVENTGWGYGVHFNAVGLADFAAQWAAVLGGTPDLAPNNGDFESNTALADGASGPIDTSVATSPSVIGWRALAASGEAVADGDCGYYNPNNASYAGAADGGAGGGVLPHMSGRHVAYLSNSTAGAGFLQTRRATLQASQIYTLTVALGVRGNGNTFGGATLEILANGSPIATRSVIRADLDTLNGGNAANTFTDISLQASTGATVTAGQALAIRIRKTGGAGTYLDFDNVRLALGPNTPPAAPTGLSATPMDAAVALSWTASPGATSYKVSITPGTVVTTTASPYTVTGLTNGTSYQLKVLGTNSVGDGAYSGVVSATPLAGVATTTTTLATLTSSTYGNPVTFSATVAPAPTGGTLQFYDNNVAIGGTVVVNTSTGAAQYTTSALTVGSHPITATFSGTTGFNGSTAGSKTQTVNPATPVVTVNVGTYAYSASAQGPDTATTGGSTGAVTFSYVGVSGTTYPASGTWPTNAGSYTCTATVVADSNYTTASSSAAPFTIAKATPVITWATPAAINVGTALGATQLNATSGGVAGNFVYTPASGAQLTLGSHTLSVQFTPTVIANYNTPAAMTVTILVKPVGLGPINLSSATGVFLADTAAGGNGTLANTSWPGANSYSGSWSYLTDGVTSPTSKWLGCGKNGWGAYPGTAGNGAGFYFTLPTAANMQTIQFFTEDSAPGRSPATMTIEGSNAGDPLVGASWTLLYSGTAGLATTPNNSAGATVTFTNITTYTRYRVLFPTIGGGEAVQLADIVATAGVASSPYDTWANGVFAHPFTDKDSTHDPDGDGLTNFQEFAFGLDPTNGSSVNPVTQPLDPATGRFQYTRRAGTGLTYQILASTNLGTWNPDPGATEVAVTTSGDIQTVTVHVSTAPLNGKLFVRVQAQ